MKNTYHEILFPTPFFCISIPIWACSSKLSPPCPFIINDEKLGIELELLCEKTKMDDGFQKCKQLFGNNAQHNALNNVRVEILV